MIPLYEVPNKTWVKLEDGTKLFFDHVDGMYSFCKTEDDKIVHPAAWTKVEVIK